jgi:S1-C subfamily serine protease
MNVERSMQIVVSARDKLAESPEVAEHTGPQTSHPSVGDSRRPGSLLNRMAMIALAVLMLLPAHVCPAQSDLLTPESRMDLELRPGIVVIFVEYKATLGPWTVNPRFEGSGFLYRPDGYLITSGHLAQLANDKDLRAINARIQDARPAIINEILNNEARNVLHRALTPEEIEKFTNEINKLIDAGNMHIDNISLTVLLRNRTHYEGGVKAYSDPTDEGGKDIAIIKIDGKNLPTVALGNSDELNVGDPLTAISYSDPFWASGLLSERSDWIPTATKGHVSTTGLFSAVDQSEALDYGDSGGPAFDASGKVVGILTFSHYNSDSSLSKGEVDCVPINTAMEFVRTAGAPPERGAFDEIWHKALDAYEDRHWYQAHELMGSVLKLAPDQPDALNLQMEAAEHLRSEGFLQYWMDRLGATGLSIAGGVLVVAILLVVLLTRKPKIPTVETTPLANPAGPPIAAAAIPPAPAPNIATARTELAGKENLLARNDRGSPGVPDDLVRVFVSYAREDKRWLDPEYRFNLVPFLADSLRRQGVSFWIDKRLVAGDEYRRLIESEIDRADIALLMVTQSFLNSQFIESVEMPHIEGRARRGQMLAAPVLVEPCDWQDYPLLADRQMVPASNPLVEYTENDARWAKVRFEILDALKTQVKRIRDSRLVPQPPTSRTDQTVTATATAEPPGPIESGEVIGPGDSGIPHNA